MELNKNTSIDNFSFKDLVAKGLPLVDKTEILFNLLKRGITYYSLFRPDGFGKSTLLDTIEVLFKGEKELFKGLYIEDKWNFSDTYPVIRLNMKALTETSVEGNKKILMEHLGEYAEQYGIEDKLYPTTSPSALYSNLVEEIHRKTGKKVVVLIDDYDAPLLGNIHRGAGEEIYDMVYRMYSLSKPLEAHIKLFFMTGITRHTPNTLFSGFNNVVDISNNEDYAAICGFTDEELDEYFTPFFEKHFREEAITSDEEKAAFRKRISEYYGGYRFTPDSDVTLYKPSSIGKFISGGCREFCNHMENIDSHKLVKELMAKYPQLFEDRLEYMVAEDRVDCREIYSLFKGELRDDPVYSFLLQTGYLTYLRMEVGICILGWPNREVTDSLQVKTQPCCQE